jgi:hypothetical protein
MINKLIGVGKVLDKRDTRETHTSRVWREELAEILEVNIRHREALKQGSIALARSAHGGLLAGPSARQFG